MIKFILKVIEDVKNVARTDQSKITLSFSREELDEKLSEDYSTSVQKMFDESAKQLVRERLHDIIKSQLVDMCYTEEEIKQRDQCKQELEKLKYDSKYLKKQIGDDLCHEKVTDYLYKKFPKSGVFFGYDRGDYGRLHPPKEIQFCTDSFYLDSFIENLLKNEGI